MCNSSKLFDFTQFADDSTLTTSGTKLDLLTQDINNEFANVLDWLIVNKLIINLKKTYCMMFTNKREDKTLIIKTQNSVLEKRIRM